MKIENFNNLLKSNKVPHWGHVRSEPEELIKSFRLGPVTTKRKVKVGTISHEHVVRIDTEEQRLIFESLTKLNARANFVVGLASQPNDMLALELASSLIYALFRYRHINFKYVNTSYDIEKTLDDTIDYDVIVIHNVIPERERIYKIRDLITAFPRALRLVVIGGINPLSYFDKFLRLPISGLVNIVGVNKQLTGFASYGFKPREYPVFTNDAELLLKPWANKLLKGTTKSNISE